MTESDGEAVGPDQLPGKKSWRVLSWELEDRLAKFKRIRADPKLGMQHELPLMADLVEMIAEIERQLCIEMCDLR